MWNTAIWVRPLKDRRYGSMFTAILCMLQVAFFLPQLVQLLRGDSNGMIQRFLFTAAARSNVFAYNLVCILKASFSSTYTDHVVACARKAAWQSTIA